MSSNTPLLAVAVSNTHDEKSETTIFPMIYQTREEADQALWKIIVDKEYYYSGVIELWESLFDGENRTGYAIDNDEYYDETNNGTNYKLIRKLITPEMNSRIKEFKKFEDEKIKLLDDNKRRCYFNNPESERAFLNTKFAMHLRSVPMTEKEIAYFMETYSENSEEFGYGPDIITSWEIREVKIAQLPRTSQ